MRAAWAVLAVGLIGCGSSPEPVEPPKAEESPLLVEAPGTAPKGMVWIPGGEFQMGSDEGFPDERPVHDVGVTGFWMDAHEVTNDEFAAFAKATEYKTVAERPLPTADFPELSEAERQPGSLVLVDKGAVWTWEWTTGASWRAPEGPGSSIEGRGDHPVVHIAWEDAEAYCAWAGKSLPTEAEWERAARGGGQAEFIWGDEREPGGKPPANLWDGEFPRAAEVRDGWRRTAPVGQFAANAFGLFDMAGNVWEWCADGYRADAYAGHRRRDPYVDARQAEEERPGMTLRVQRGGSYQCADNACQGYRPSARMKTTADSGHAHAGFRCVVRPGKRESG